MRFALYCRKSRQTEKGESIENQAALCRAYIAQNFPSETEHEILPYQDEGFSGKNTERPQFQKMMAELMKGRFDFLICYRLDRVSRSIGDFSALIALLAKYHTGFISVKEKFDTANPMGRAMMYISSVFSQLERETIAERIRDNMELLAKTGIWLGGVTPTGFYSEKVSFVDEQGKKHTYARLSPIERELSLVRFLYKEFQKRPLLTPLCRELDRLEIRTKKGNCFTPASIRGILQNPVYCAIDQASLHYFKSHGSHLFVSTHNLPVHCAFMAYHKNSFVTGSRKAQEKNTWILAAGAHPAIVSGKDWVQVQNLLTEQAPGTKRRQSHPYAVLSGLLFCAACQNPMRAKKGQPSARDPQTPVYYYICEGKERSRRCLCQTENLQGADTDTKVLKKLFACFYSPTELSKRLLEQYPSLQKPIQDAAMLDHEIDKLFSILAKTEEPAAISCIQKRLETLCRKKEALAVQTPPSSSEQLVYTQSSLEALLFALPFSEKQRLFAACIEKAVWDGRTLHLHWKA